MNGLVLIGVAVNVIGVLIGVVTLDAVTVVAAVGIPALLVSGAGIYFIHQGRQPLGAYLVMAGSTLLLPVGAIGALGGYRSAKRFKTGTSLGGRRHEEKLPRPRSWTHAVVLFGLGAGVSLFWALIAFTNTRMDSLNDPLAMVAAVVFAILAALEAILLWNRQEEAFKLGLVLAAVALFVCSLTGFYLENYIAVGLLLLPVYAAFLLYQGREQVLR